MYYGRHFRSADGSVPALLGPRQIHWGTVSSLTLPADNGTWAVVVVAGAKDTALRPLREADRWEAVVRALPLVAHWLDGTPIDDGVQVMAAAGGPAPRLRGRRRQPVATGVVAVADSWACTNPANGRGASIGMLHALTLRDQLRAVGLDDPAAFADAFHAATAETVEPWYRATLTTDRHRLGEIEAGIRGAAYDSPDPAYQLEKALEPRVRAGPGMPAGGVRHPVRAADARGGLRPARAAREDPSAGIRLARRAAVRSRPASSFSRWFQ